MDRALVLVDTGLGTRDYAQPTWYVGAFLRANQVPSDPEETAIRQVERLGHGVEDVRHIVLTHLHLDHAGGLPDFPWAKVHVLADEYEAATRRPMLSCKDLAGYHRRHWAHEPDWALHQTEGELWFGLDCVRILDSSPGEVLLVPLAGHSRGHCGVAVRAGGGWLLHCGDAFIRQMQVDPVHPRSAFPGWARPLERYMFPDAPLERVRALLREHGGEVRAFCSHDRVEFARLARGQAAM
jgi:glyoxylase-like metal-dependent hydrolase (beta-lactamase superfamily II)